MKIRKTRINNARANLGFIDYGVNVIFGIENINRFQTILERIGFTNRLSVGERVLPRPVGRISGFNAEGGFLRHKDQPKETVTYQREHHWTECHGKARVRRTGYVDFSVERYPRTIIKPPSIEFTISARSDGSKILIAPVIEYNSSNEKEIKHIINLFLEIFGECDVFSENLDEIIDVRIKRLNWEVLPAGPMPWSQLYEKLRPLLNRVKPLIRPVAKWRLETLRSYNPDFVAIGHAGFSGYVVYAFESKDLYIFESIYYGNATYVFGEDWEELSKKSKAEILDENLQKSRIIHREGWRREIDNLFNV